MDKKEKTLESNIIYKGKILTLNNDKVLCPNDNISYREIVHHHGGVGILFKKEDRILLIKQYRYAYDEELYEIPAGKLEENEDPKSAAIRELEEETGYLAKKIIKLGNIYPTCGYSNEIIHLYFVEEATKTKTHFDEDEFIDASFFNINEIKDMINKGIIKDAKTICALYYYLNYEPRNN